MAVRSAARLPTASMVGLAAGSASPASRPFGPCGAALRAGLDPGSIGTLSVIDRTSRRLPPQNRTPVAPRLPPARSTSARQPPGSLQEWWHRHRTPAMPRSHQLASHRTCSPLGASRPGGPPPDRRLAGDVAERVSGPRRVARVRGKSPSSSACPRHEPRRPQHRTTPEPSGSRSSSCSPDRPRARPPNAGFEKVCSPFVPRGAISTEVATAKSAHLQPLLRGERWGSNPRPPGPQPGALPTELRPPSDATGKSSVESALIATRPAQSAFSQREAVTGRQAGRSGGSAPPGLEQPHGVGPKQSGELNAERDGVAKRAGALPRSGGCGGRRRGGHPRHDRWRAGRRRPAPGCSSLQSLPRGREHPLGHILALSLRGSPPPPHAELRDLELWPFEDGEPGEVRAPFAFSEVDGLFANPRLDDGAELLLAEVEAPGAVGKVAKLYVVHESEACRSSPPLPSRARMIRTASGLESIST